MFHQTSNDGEEDGTVLARALIISAEVSSKSVYSGALPRHVVAEFLVACDVAVGIIATGMPFLKPFWIAVQGEFAQFDPNHLELLEGRLKSYFDALAGVQGSEIVPTLVRTFAGHVRPDVATLSWASDVLTEWLGILGEMITPDSAGVQ